MRVLVTWGSKKGGTAGIGRMIAEVLADLGHDVRAMPADEVSGLDGYQAVIVGGGVAAAQGERLLGRVRDMVHHKAPVRTKIVLSELGKDAQILGAVRLALDARDASRA